MKKSDIEWAANELRKASIKHPNRLEALRLSSKKVPSKVSKSGKQLFKTYYGCAKCREWFRDISSMEVDHIIECGPIGDDLHDFFLRLIVPVEKLQVLCITCHMSKTVAYNNSRLRYKRK